MATLVVRNLDPSLLEALMRLAAEHGRSVEAEHRAILEAALAPSCRKSFAKFISSMPNVGRDSDFVRK